MDVGARISSYPQVPSGSLKYPQVPATTRRYLQLSSNGCMVASVVVSSASCICTLSMQVIQLIFDIILHKQLDPQAVAHPSQ